MVSILGVVVFIGSTPESECALLGVQCMPGLISVQLRLFRATRCQTDRRESLAALLETCE